jgi:hypothetical protein
VISHFTPPPAFQMPDASAAEAEAEEEQLKQMIMYN